MRVVAAAHRKLSGSRLVYGGTLRVAFPLGSLVVGRVLGWLVGVRGRNRSPTITAD
jgi:hypothetical protein